MEWLQTGILVTEMPLELDASSYLRGLLLAAATRHLFARLGAQEHLSWGQDLLDDELLGRCESSR